MMTTRKITLSKMVAMKWSIWTMMRLKLKTTRCKSTKSAAYQMECSCSAAAVLMMIKMRTASQ